MNRFKLYTVNAITLIRIIGIPLLFMIDNDIYRLLYANFLFATDFFDGYFARRFEVSSTFGAVADLVADKLLVIIILLAEVLSGDVNFIIFGLIAFREIYSMVLRFNHFRKEHTLIRASFAGKLKTAFQFIALNLTMLNIPGYNIALIIVIIMSYYSFFGYFKQSKETK